MNAIYQDTPQHQLNRKLGKFLQKWEFKFKTALLSHIELNEDSETVYVEIECDMGELQVKADDIYTYLSEWECILFEDDDHFETKLQRLEDCEELAYIAYKSIAYKHHKHILLCK